MYGSRVNGHNLLGIFVGKPCNAVCLDVEWCECFVNWWIPQWLVYWQWGGVGRGLLEGTELSLTKTRERISFI